MNRQRLPLSYFEKFTNLILTQIPDFFKAPSDPQRSYKRFNNPIGKGTGNIKKIRNARDIYLFQERYLRGELSYHEAVSEQDIERLSVRDRINFVYMIHQFNGKQVDHRRFHDVMLEKLLDHTWMMNAAGRKIFRVEQQCMDELLLTNISKVDYEFLNLPFPSILLSLPFNQSLRIRGDLVEWVFISQAEANGCKALELFCVTKQEHFFFVSFTFTPGEILAQLKEQIRQKYSVISKDEDNGRTSQQAKQEHTDLFSFLLSVLFYINSKDADTTHVLPNRIMPKSDSSIPVCSLGRNIKINRDLSGLSTSEDGVASDRMIHILKWTVRGHFRKQPVGEGCRDRKIIWIRPFLKGREREIETIPAKPSIYKL